MTYIIYLQILRSKESKNNDLYSLFAIQKLSLPKNNSKWIHREKKKER